ncbi:hypothetical protein KCU89_g2726, partial [Aureobasidium melanogenum]
MMIFITDGSVSKFFVHQGSCAGTFEELVAVTVDYVSQKTPLGSIAQLGDRTGSSNHKLSSDFLPFPHPHLILIDKAAKNHVSSSIGGDPDSNKLPSPKSLDRPTLLGLKVEVSGTSTGGWDLVLQYDNALYNDDELNRFWDNFIVFLSSVIRDPCQPIDTVPMCGSKEIAHLQKFYWNTTFKRNSWQNMTICQKIMEQAHQNPDAVAVVDSHGASVSYSQLAERAQSVVTLLHDLGVTPGDNVCLLMQPTVELLVAVFGIVMARGCYVALESDFAPERLAFMISDCGARVILHDDETSSLADKMTLKLNGSSRVVSMNEAPLTKNGHNPIGQALEHDPLYMVYTSGSTGKPKGLTISHANAQQMLASLGDHFQFSSSDRFLQQTSLCFDLSVVQIFSALSAGARVCIATADLRKDPYGLAEFMMQSCVSVTYFTPTHFSLLLEHGSGSLRKCHSYRVALFAGEILPIRVVKAFYDMSTPAIIYNAWGPSEPVVQTVIHKVDYPGSGEFNIPIGTPLPNCRDYITDRSLNPLPAALVGEICVGGPQVATGYLNRPEENAKSFVKNPFCSSEDIGKRWTRLFRSGDKSRFLSNGELEYHGRISGDKQVKLRGFRIDMAEIEQVLFQRSSTSDGQGIVDVVVTARSGEEKSNVSLMTDERQLIAFIVTKKPVRDREQQTEYAALLHRNIKPHLNDYMLPIF